mgnify:CR=1 FL=1
MLKAFGNHRPGSRPILQIQFVDFDLVSRRSRGNPRGFIFIDEKGTGRAFGARKSRWIKSNQGDPILSERLRLRVIGRDRRFGVEQIFRSEKE